MVTTCPHCATSFNVAPEVLLSRNGRVRCGQCKQIFDGLLHMATPDPVAPPPVPPLPLEVVAAASPAFLPVVTASGDNAPREAPPPPTSVQSSVRVAAKASAAHAAADDEGFDAPSPAPQRPARWPWAFGAALAALVLAAQVHYRYRSEMAAHFPVVKPVLTQLCAWAGCGVPPLQQPAALNIEASDLQVIDPTRPHIVQLTATLRNRAAIEVGYPAFDLVLTDNREHALARRVIVPADYLPGSAAQAAQGAHAIHAAQSAIAANAEVTVRIDIDTSGLPAAGFRLNLTPAPSH